jgi:hypothetical protein
MPLGYEGGVPDNDHSDKVSTYVGMVAWRLATFPQALRTITTHIVARRARRAFMQYETDGELEGLLLDNTP